MHSIYLISSPSNKCYVGITHNALERWKYHQTRKRSAVYCAVKKYGKENMVFGIIETHESLDEALEAEQFWIQYLGTKAPHGYNRTGGGEMGKTHTEETRRKISESRKGKPLSSEHKRKVSESLIGRQFSTIHRERLSLAGRKRPPPSEETRKKMSDAKKGKRMSDQVRANMSKSRKGKPQREEAKMRRLAAIAAYWEKYWREKTNVRIS
jgi:group I intron endonuclease